MTHGSGSSSWTTESAPSGQLAELTAEQRERLSEVLESYLAALERGAPLSEEHLLAAHPDLAAVLREHFRSLGELHSLAAGMGSEAEATPAEESGAKRIGDFELRREIGQGGMGIVYEARQISLNRPVAVKLLPFAAVLNSQQIARFKNEAQAAAQIQHPHIVPVYAIGVERGVHFYAMQLIDGLPLDRMVEQWRKRRSGRGAGARREAEGEHPTEESFGGQVPEWDSAKIVRWGMEAAEALHAAHEEGIVHRDIKPSNLLVDRGGKLWVTDFGLARFQRDVSLTRTGDVVGTMRYMSPEQALGLSALVDHRTDIYSLGATLYELLCLRAAFPQADGAGFLRRLEREDPPRLRALQPSLPRDLETVILKAMARSREDRYLTARLFAEDLRCVLEGQPTRARPPAWFERLTRWGRRHRRAVAGTVLAALLTLVALVASLWTISREKDRAERNLQRAENYFRGARRTLDRFGVQLSERLAEVPGAEPVRRELLQETLAYYRSFAQEARHDPSLRVDMALTFAKVGELADWLGSDQEALAGHEQAAAAFAELVRQHPDRSEYRRQWALSLNNLALVLSRIGRVEEAARHWEKALGLQDALVRESPGNSSLVAEQATTLMNVGLLRGQLGKGDQARAAQENAVTLLRQALSRHPQDSALRQTLAAALHNLAAAQPPDGVHRAIQHYQEALAIQTALATGSPGGWSARREVGLTLNNLGDVLDQAGRRDEAIASYTQAIRLQDELARLAPLHPGLRRDLAVTHNNLGLLYSRHRDREAARQEFSQALAIQEALVAQFPQDLALQSSLGGVHNNLGMLWEAGGDLPKAAQSFADAVRYQQQAFVAAPEIRQYREFLGRHYVNQSRVCRALGQWPAAWEAIRARAALWPQEAEQLIAAASDLAAVYNQWVEQGALAGSAAEPYAEEVVEVLRSAVQSGWKRPADFVRRPPFAAFSATAACQRWLESTP